MHQNSWFSTLWVGFVLYKFSEAAEERYPFPVIYSPYVSQLLKNLQHYRAKNSYNETEVLSQISILSTRFSTVITLGMGSNYGEDQNSSGSFDSQSLISVAVAKHNKQVGEANRIKVIQGILVDKFFPVEIKTAIKAMKTANAIFPGTVIGFCFNVEDLDSPNVKYIPGTIHTLSQIVTSHNNDSVSISLTIRLGESDCYFIPKNTHIQKILPFLDSLICEYKPFKLSMKTSVNFTNLTKQIIEFHSLIQNSTGNGPRILIETGWPTIAIKHKDPTKLSVGTMDHLNNFVSFWTHICGLGKKMNSFIVFKEAFDQPNMCQVANEPAADCSYGYWFVDSQFDETSFVRKIDLISYNNDDKQGYVLGTSIPIVLIVIFVLIIVFLAFCFSKHKSHGKDVITKDDYLKFLKGRLEHDEMENSSYNVLAYYDVKLELPKNSFSINTNRILGVGAFGTVFEGNINGINSFAAFKTFKVSSRVTMKSILAEIKIMSYIGAHPNIIQLLGAYTAEAVKGIAYLAMEFCEKGSLQNYLRSSSSKLQFAEANRSLSTNSERYASDPTTLSKKILHFNENLQRGQAQISDSQMLKWSLEICEAMIFLSSKNVVHGDLATRNVLLTADLTVKVTDFGLSRRLYGSSEYQKTSKDPMPWRWMAVESLKHLVFTSKSDVWSYGITLWEVFSFGDIPYGGLGWKSDFINMLHEGVRPCQPPSCSYEIYSLINQCWKLEPTDRPSFEEIKHLLEIKESDTS